MNTTIIAKHCIMTRTCKWSSCLQLQKVQFIFVQYWLYVSICLAQKLKPSPMNMVYAKISRLLILPHYYILSFEKHLQVWKKMKMNRLINKGFICFAVSKIAQLNLELKMIKLCSYIDCENFEAVKTSSDPQIPRLKQLLNGCL